MAAGDLRRSVPPGGLGEVGTLVAALDHMAGSLRALVGTISNVADRTARRGGQLLEHAEAQGMAEHAGAARGASELTRRTVEENRARMASVAEEVERVSEIARQTDLLALNAGMEAAGPGEAGRGFTIVAREVRKLAERSARAAEAIKASVSSAVTDAEALSGLAGQVAGAVERTTAVVREVASDCEAQAQFIREISAGMSELGEVTHAHASTAEQAAEAGSGLARQAADLRAAVDRFKLAEPSPDAGTPILRASAGGPGACFAPTLADGMARPSTAPARPRP